MFLSIQIFYLDSNRPNNFVCAVRAGINDLISSKLTPALAMICNKTAPAAMIHQNHTNNGKKI